MKKGLIGQSSHKSDLDQSLNKSKVIYSLCMAEFNFHHSSKCLKYHQYMSVMNRPGDC